MAGVKGRSGRRPKLLPSLRRRGAVMVFEVLDPDERKILERLVECARDVIEPGDDIALNLLTARIGGWLRMEHRLKHDGETVADDKGVERINAAARLSSMYYRDVVALLRDFGLTPTSRRALRNMVRETPKPAAVPCSVGVDDELGEPLP